MTEWKKLRVVASSGVVVRLPYGEPVGGLPYGSEVYGRIVNTEIGRRWALQGNISADPAHVQPIDEPPDDPPTKHIQGVDVSRWQGVIDWRKCAAQGVRFAYIKATEGINWTDPNLDTNWQGAKRIGFRVGAYHFLRHDANGQQQALHFLSKVQRKAGDLLMALDCERGGPGIAQIIQDAVNTLHQHTGRWPVIYTSRAWWHANVGRGPMPWAAQCPLWCANYYVPQPRWAPELGPLVPDAWDGAAIWQWTSALPGGQYGMSSAGLDGNAMWGDWEQVTY